MPGDGIPSSKTAHFEDGKPKKDLPSSIMAPNEDGMASSATMPVCSRPIRPASPSDPRLAAVSGHLRGLARASRSASPSAPRLAALSGHLRGLAPHQPACEPVHSSSGGPQRPSPRARTVPSACEPVRPSSGGRQRPSPRARAVPFHRAILSVKQLMQKFFAPLKQ